MRICAGQRSAGEELLLRPANLTFQAAAERAAAAPLCCRRDHGVFMNDAYIQLMTPHVRAMLASPAVAPSASLPPSVSFSSIPDDAVEIVKVTGPLLHISSRDAACCCFCMPLPTFPPFPPHILHNVTVPTLRCSCQCIHSPSRAQSR